MNIQLRILLVTGVVLMLTWTIIRIDKTEHRKAENYTLSAYFIANIFVYLILFLMLWLFDA